MDVLTAVGLRNSDVSTRDAVLTEGPTGEIDAVVLQRRFTSPTNRMEWNLIGAEIPFEFGIYTVFNSYEYRGTILSVTNQNAALPVMDVTIAESNNSSDMKSLIISLPGLDPVILDIPSASEESPFQNIGIRLRNSQLLAVVNCSVADFVSISDVPDQLVTTNATVEIFGESAIVSGPMSIAAIHSLLIL